MTTKDAVAPVNERCGLYKQKPIGTPLLADFNAANGTLRSDEVPVFDDPFLIELINTRPMRRLKRIGFLGAIDYVRKGSGNSAHRRRHNRLEHCLGVAKLAEIYAVQRNLNMHQRRFIVAAALLHDVGHGPLSHTLEPVFEAEFGINHHQVGRNIIRGETRLGNEIAQTLRTYSIDPEELIALIEGAHDSSLNFLFGSQINLDTLEGITRCRAFIGRRNAFETSFPIVARIAQSDEFPTTVLDEFWRLKHSVYNIFINADIGLALDSIAQSYMRDNISLFRDYDFLSNEDDLRKKHPHIFHFLNLAVTRSNRLRKEISQNWLDTPITVKKRSFFVDEREPLVGSETLDRRYLQSRTRHSIRLEEIIS